ncbi:uncharacterized protein C12orf71 homolog [Heterocephalus glaber]|uniref:Uncharacterized protein C12orf71 homolog n=1 Tax=Heterocephalus glaber TaxID=10181 RepID=A0AAX6T9Y0_HETGA|nr:uncharacterized protein C12orf71 homolog [Heterocephalus glaber]
MASPPPGGNSPDTGDSNSEIASSLSSSVGYSPCKDTISLEESILLEDTTSIMSSSDNFIPPIQGTWVTEGVNRRIIQQNLIQDNPQQICKLSITVAWVDNDDFEELTAYENLNGGKRLLDRCPKDQTQLTEDKLEAPVKLLETCQDVHKDDEEIRKDDNENKKYNRENNKENQRNIKDDDFDWIKFSPVEDLKLCNSCPPYTAQVTRRKHMGQDLPMSKSQENKDVVQLEILQMLKEQELAEMEGEVTGKQDIDIVDIASTFSEWPEEEVMRSDPQTTTCLKVGQAFNWLKKRILSALRRRWDSGEATKSHQQQTPKRRRPLRSRKIQPEELLKK